MDESILGVTLGQCAPTGLVWVLLNRYLVTIDFVQTGAPLLYVAPPQLNTIGGPTRVIGNTTVYNGKRVFATSLVFVSPSPGFLVDGLPRLAELLTLRAPPIWTSELFRCRALELLGHRAPPLVAEH